MSTNQRWKSFCSTNLWRYVLSSLGTCSNSSFPLFDRVSLLNSTWSQISWIRIVFCRKGLPVPSTVPLIVTEGCKNWITARFLARRSIAETSFEERILKVVCFARPIMNVSWGSVYCGRGFKEGVRNTKHFFWQLGAVFSQSIPVILGPQRTRFFLC